MCLQGAVFLRNSIESVVSIERLPENVSFSTASGGMRSSRPTVNTVVLGGFMKICEQLHMIKGITAVIGSGGKTTLLRILAEELSGTVILTTSTHILPFAGIPLLVTDDIEQVRCALALHRVICMGTPAAEGKLTAPALPFSVLADAADYVIVEADGSKRLPLKAHASHEPVIPENTPQNRVRRGCIRVRKASQTNRTPTGTVLCTHRCTHERYCHAGAGRARHYCRTLSGYRCTQSGGDCIPRNSKKIHRSTEIQRICGCLHNINSHFIVNHRIHFP